MVKPILQCFPTSSMTDEFVVVNPKIHFTVKEEERKLKIFTLRLEPFLIRPMSDPNSWK